MQNSLVTCHPGYCDNSNINIVIKPIRARLDEVPALPHQVCPNLFNYFDSHSLGFERLIVYLTFANLYNNLVRTYVGMYKLGYLVFANLVYTHDEVLSRDCL